MDTDTELTQRLHMIWPLLDERTRRLFAATEALALGHAGEASLASAAPPDCP